MRREVILASKSPRRREMLGQFIKFSVESKSIEENYDDLENPDVNVMSIAFQKALAVARENESAVVIGADTLVYSDYPLGKPNDRAEAKRMLKRLSGKEHTVFTGCSVICLEESYKRIFCVETKVKFKELNNEMLEKYLNTGEYKDKAGAYGIQGFGSLLIEGIEGDFQSVVGLPISSLSDVLKRDFDIDLMG